MGKGEEGRKGKGGGKGVKGSVYIFSGTYREKYEMISGCGKVPRSLRYLQTLAEEMR